MNQPPITHSAFIQRLVLVAAMCGLTPMATTHGQDLTKEDAAIHNRARSAYQAERFEEVIELLTPLRKKYPRLSEIPRLLTHAHHELGHFARAREAAVAAIGAGRFSADVLTRLAQIDQQRDDRVALLSTVRLLTVVDAGNSQWRLIYGDLLAAARSFDESGAVFRALILARPDSAALHLRLGNVLNQQDRLKEAAVSLETAWRLGAVDPRLPSTIADLWRRLKDDRQALTWTERALSLENPPKGATRLRLAQLYLNLKEWDRARATAKALIDSRETKLKGQAHVLLGSVAVEQGRLETAVEHWRAAIDAGADSPRLLAAVAAQHFNSGEFKMAAELLQRVVAKAANSDTADEQHLRILVISLIRSDQRASARAHLRRYVEHHGLSDGAKKLIRLWVASEKPSE